MKKSEEWSAGRLMILLFLSFDIVVIAVWLVLYFREYETIAKVVTGVWTGVLALLAVLGVKTEEKKSLARLLGLRPVKILTVVYTVLILSILGPFSYKEFFSGTFTLTAKPPDLAVIVKNSDSQKIVIPKQVIGNNKEWRLPAGMYILTAAAPGYMEETTRIQILPRGKNAYSVTLKKAPAERGTIRLSPGLQGMTILVNGKLESDSAPAEIRVKPGVCRLTLLKQGGDDRFGYYFEKTLYVPANKTVLLQAEVRQIKLPTLIITLPQGERGSDYSLKSSWGTPVELGKLNDDKWLPVFPGTYTLSKRRPSGTENSDPFVVRPEDKDRRVVF